MWFLTKRNALRIPSLQIKCFLYYRTIFNQTFTLMDWACITSPPTQYRLYGRRFLQVKRPNQQYQSTEGETFTLIVFEKGEKGQLYALYVSYHYCLNVSPRLQGTWKTMSEDPQGLPYGYMPAAGIIKLSLCLRTFRYAQIAHVWSHSPTTCLFVWH